MKRLSRSRKRRKIRRRPINVLASVLTTFGLYCGTASIFAAIAGRYEKAAYLIGGALVFDILDGSVAKITRSVSEFGKQLDSLCDLVSFGVAPAVLIYTAYLQEERGVDTIADSVMAIVFVICGALRLARYNVYQSGARDYFVGLPNPAAGGTIASFVLFTQFFEWRVAFWVLGPLTLALAYLMVSTVRYPKHQLKAFLLRPRHAFRFLALCVVGIAVFDYASKYSLAIVLFPLAMAYVFFGISDEIYTRLRRKRILEQAGAQAEPLAQEAPSSGPPPSKTGDLL